MKKQPTDFYNITLKMSKDFLSGGRFSIRWASNLL
jgi:hypothetical protein